MGQSDAPGQFDPFANQGGPAAEDAESLAEARRVTDEQLRNADYSVDLPEPLGNADDDTTAVSPAADPDAASAGDPDAASAIDTGTASAGGTSREEPARRLLADEGAPIDDAPVSAARADAVEHSDD